MMRIHTAFLFLIIALSSVAAPTDEEAKLKQMMLERARAAELPGVWTPAPIKLPSHFAAAYAQRMCSAIFIAGMAPAFARETLGDYNALVSAAQRAKLGEPIVNRTRREVRVQTSEGVIRTARQLGSQGCVIFPEGSNRVNFIPSKVEPKIPVTASTLWPMGDQLPENAPAGFDTQKVAAALNAAFSPEESLTQAFVVTWKGQLIGERYGLGATADTPLEGWSMGKSVVASLLGVLMQKGVYRLDQPAPIPEWQSRVTRVRLSVSVT